jgi:hypothetical protein
MATNIDIQAQLNQLLAEQNKLLEESAKLAKDQASLTRDMITAMRGANFKDVTNDIQNASQAVTGAAEATRGYGSANQDVFDKVNTALKEALKHEEAAGKGMESLTAKVKKFAVATSAIDGFVQGLRFTSNMLHTVVAGGVGLVESLGNIGAAIVAIPFKMLSGLIHMADSGGGGNELQQALEDIRKEFGALHDTSGKAIVDMARSMKGELAQTGLSTTRIFGNLAERLKTIQEYAHNLGPLFSVLAGQFVKNAEAIGAYYKGLGLTEEAQKAVATRSFALGTAITDELRQITNYSQQLSKAFNGAAGSAKEISRDMGTLMADFHHFGGISTKEIGQAVVYFRRLGVEVSKVLGVIDRYDNFEDAANGAAQLSQAFGLNVDALQMMKAQNPAERVEMLRKSFFAAGRSVENMTRQERALLAQQTGLDDSALDLVFSMKNQGLSYDQVTKKADAAKKKQLTQVEAMKALADSIERLVKSGSSGSGGFIDRFIQGFGVGIQRSSEFREIMRNLRVDLRVAYTEGIKVGRAFVDMFPGVKDVFKGIADLFEPRRFRAMFRKVTDAFKDFFKDMTDNPQTAMPRLLERLKKDFFSWFQGNSQNGQRILDGFRKFFVALSNIAGGLLKVAMNGVRDGIKYITDLISGRESLSAGGAGHGALGFIGSLLTPMIDAIKEAGPSLWKAVKEMFSVIWTKAQPWLQQNFLKIIGVLAGPALLGMAGRAIATSIAGMFVQGLVGFVSNGGIGRALNGVRGLFNRQVGAATTAMAQVPATGGAGRGAGEAAAGTVKGAEEAAQAASGSRVNWGRALVQMAAITLFITVGMVGIMYAIFRFAKAMQENHLTLTSIAGASLAMITTALSMVAIAGAVKLLSAINLNAGMAGRILIGVAIVGAVGAAMAFGARGLIALFGDIPMGKIAKTVLVMGATGAFFLAAAGVTAIAALVGAIALAGGGIGAIAIAAGLAVIAATITVMTVQGMAIMRAIDQFRPGPGFVEKARIFVEVMKGVGSFAASVAQLVEATRPGIMDFLRGSGSEQQRETLKSVQNVIETLGGQIISIVNTVRRNVQALRGTEQELKSAQIIGQLLSGVGDLATALRPPSEAMQSPGFFASLNGDTVSRRISLVTDYVSTVGNQLNMFMRSIVVMMTRDLPTGFTEAQARAAQVIPAILGAVGTFARVLTPSAALVQELNHGADFAGQLTHLGTFVRNLLNMLRETDLFGQVGTLITNVVNALSSRSLSPQQIELVKAGLPIVASALQAVSGITGAITNMTQDAAHGAGNVFQATQFVTTLFQQLQNVIPNLVTGLVRTFTGLDIRALQNAATGMNALKSVIEVVTQIASSNMPQQADVLAGFTRLGGSLSAIQQGMSALNNQLLASTDFRATATGLANTIRTQSLTKVSHAIRDMVHEVNDISTSIRGIDPININTELQRIGDHLGLGANGTYTIQNRNFTINVGVTVRFDNNGLDAFELAMLRRNGPGAGTRITTFDHTR